MNISVCIPSYNHADFIEQTVRSAARQSVQPTEIIVSDDCSTDNTMEVLERLQAEIPFLKVVPQRTNVGVVANADACLRMGTGDFLVQLDSDDSLAPNYIERLGGLLAKHPNAGYAHAAVQEVDHEGAFLHQKRLIRKTGFQPAALAFKAALKGYRVTSNIIMIRRTALAELNYLTGRSTHTQDYHLSVAMAAAGYGNVYLDEVLTYFRNWTDPESKRKRRKHAEITGIRRVFDDVFAPAYVERNLNPADLWRSRASFACQYADCLAWPVYSTDEKRLLEAELHRLSPAPKVKLYTWAYLHGLGGAVNAVSTLQHGARQLLKNVLLRLRGMRVSGVN